MSSTRFAICSSCTLCCMCSWQINDDENRSFRNTDNVWLGDLPIFVTRLGLPLFYGQRLGQNFFALLALRVLLEPLTYHKIRFETQTETSMISSFVRQSSDEIANRWRTNNYFTSLLPARPGTNRTRTAAPNIQYPFAESWSPDNSDPNTEQNCKTSSKTKLPIRRSASRKIERRRWTTGLGQHG